VHLVIAGKKTKDTLRRLEGLLRVTRRPVDNRSSGHREPDAMRGVAALKHIEDAWRLDAEPMRKPRVVRVRRAAGRIHSHRPWGHGARGVGRDDVCRRRMRRRTACMVVAARGERRIDGARRENG
jgi:hypothetical protein